MGAAERFRAVYQSSHAPIRAFIARRVEGVFVDDLTADVFSVAWRKLDTVAEGEEMPWLHRIASYVVANHRRKSAREGALLARLFMADSAPSATEVVEIDQELARAWDSLRPAEREVIALVVIDEIAVHEAARVLKISANALSIRLHRAKKRLAQLLSTHPEGTARKISAPGDMNYI